MNAENDYNDFVARICIEVGRALAVWVRREFAATGNTADKIRNARVPFIKFSKRSSVMTQLYLQPSLDNSNVTIIILVNKDSNGLTALEKRLHTGDKPYKPRMALAQF